MAMLRQIHADVKKNGNGRKSQFVSMLLETSAIDGRICVRDVIDSLTAAIGIWGAGIGIGFCVNIGASASNWLFLMRFNFVGLGICFGGIAGLGIAAVRLGVDLWHRPPAAQAKPHIDTSDNGQVPYSHKGAEVWIQSKTDGGSRAVRGVILPDLPADYVTRMCRKAAVAVFVREQNFSRRQAGSNFGEYFPEVQQELIRLQLAQWIGKGPNAGCELTPDGEEWLRGFL